jgi:hypothetical protein
MTRLILSSICLFGSIGLFIVWGLTHAYPS